MGLISDTNNLDTQIVHQAKAWARAIADFGRGAPAVQRAHERLLELAREAVAREK